MGCLPTPGSKQIVHTYLLRLCCSPYSPVRRSRRDLVNEDLGFHHGDSLVLFRHLYAVFAESAFLCGRVQRSNLKDHGSAPLAGWVVCGQFGGGSCTLRKRCGTTSGATSRSILWDWTACTSENTFCESDFNFAGCCFWPLSISRTPVLIILGIISAGPQLYVITL